jgi:hypothetical protein
MRQSTGNTCTILSHLHQELPRRGVQRQPCSSDDQHLFPKYSDEVKAMYLILWTKHADLSSSREKRATASDACGTKHAVSSIITKKRSAALPISLPNPITKLWTGFLTPQASSFWAESLAKNEGTFKQSPEILSVSVVQWCEKLVAWLPKNYAADGWGRRNGYSLL